MSLFDSVLLHYGWEGVALCGVLLVMLGEYRCIITC